MIRNDKEFSIAVEQMARLIDALADLKQSTFSDDQKLFAIMAEADIEHLARIRTEIAEYLGEAEDAASSLSETAAATPPNVRN